jgi:tetratricopeptide (TPR) repeat protein
MNRRERRAAGQNSKAASSAATTPAALCELGHRHLAEGRTLDAQLCCQEALAIDPNLADALHLMGLLAQKAEQLDHAILWFSRAIEREEKSRFLLGLGHALKRLGRLEEAFKAFDRAVELDIDSAEAWKPLAQMLADINRRDEATLAFQHVLKLDPQDADAAHQAGFLTYHAGEAEAALALFDEADRLRANHAPTLHMRALALAGLGRFEEAADELARAHALAPDDADICNDRGVFLRRLGRCEEALTWFEKALALQANVKVSLNKAFALERLRRFDEALAIYAGIKAADPDHAGADFNTGLLRLMAGDYESGFSLREARWKVSSLSIARYNFDRPMWQGKEPIAGKTILIYQDEGLGDVIQFARYVPMVASLGARVILVVDDALLPLLSRLSGVAECLSRSVRRNVSFDVHCAVTSLALAFNTRLETIPSAVPYLPAPEESRRRIWEHRLGPHHRMRIGLTWSGNPKHDDDHNRSIALRSLLPLLDLDATFVSLQKDVKPQDQATLSAETRILDLTAHLTDFVETAALVSCLDLVISVDTSMAHLAGALACPTLILLPYAPDWRWLLDRDDSPWYPTARLFRQGEACHYAEVVERVREELAARISAWSTNAPAESATSLSSEDAAAMVERGFAQMREARYHEGLALIDEADRLLPDHAPTLQMRALAKYGGGRVEDALDDLARAHALDPDNADICNNMGVFVRNLGREEEALGWFDKATERQPDFIAAWGNKASSLGNLRRFDEAFAIYAALKDVDPGNADAGWAAALLHLLIGDFQAGWAGREARWKVPHLSMARYNFPQPMWLGKEPIAGKTILIHQDEGLGDTIHFARYVPMVAALGARVILLVQDVLAPLLSKLPGIAACVPMSGEHFLSFDMFCAISSLPLAFGTTLDTIPSAVPYLPTPDAARVQAWEQRLGAHDKLRVGLVWSGNPKHKNDHNRSLPLAALSPLLDLDATFVSLQKEVKPDDQASLRQRHCIIDLTAHLADFAETAALVSCLDVIITVDTSMAHLASALARPTWILLPCAPDYRWMLDREDSPWYPTARLFRQPKAGDYASVIARVRAELEACITGWSTRKAVAALYETGLALTQAGHFAEAERSCAQALALDPDHADTLHLFGLLSLQNQHYDAAVEWFSRAIRRDPKPLYLRSLGTALLRQGRREEALQVFDKALQLKPDDADLWRNLGHALSELGRADEAIMSFGQAVKLNPRDFDAAHKAALLTCQAERYEEALAYFTRCEELQADHFPSACMRALTLQKLQRFEEALAGNQRALALDPLSADTWHNTGNVLRALLCPEEALASYDQALALRPNYAPTLSNKAVALAELRRLDEAIATFRQAILADPEDAAAQWNLALLQLLLGDFEAGWAGQEARWKNNSLSSSLYPSFSQPKWLGAEPLAGKTIVAYANEGIGDTIQFVRYMPMLAARGARVVLVVPDPLYALLSGMEGVAECRPQSATPLPDCDFHVPLSSLPFAFATRLDTIPAKESYLPAPAAQRVQAWEARLGAHDKLRVGLVWAGNPRHGNDRNRSLPLALLLPLLDLDARFVSLQKDPRSDDLALLAERREIIDLTADLTDFAETAALIDCLDLVISVDTGVAHLAAALGRPTWILLPYTPDFRWLLDRDDSPWYPTARLFRQDESRDYTRVIARVRGELSARIAGHVAKSR